MTVRDTSWSKPPTKRALQGKVQRILYQSAGSPTERGYTVARFLVSEPYTNRQVTITGHFVMDPNLHYLVKGTWKYNQKYRDYQLQVVNCQELVPSSNAGFIDFFASARFANIGLRKAKAIVNYYQSDCLEKIYQNPTSLQNITVLSAENRRVIQSQIQKLHDYAALYNWFLQHDLPARIIDLVRQEDKLTPAQIEHFLQHRSFELVKVFQVSFQEADRIFQTFNPHQLDSIYRLSFLVTAVLNEQCQKTGNTYLRFDDWWKAMDQTPHQISFQQFQAAVSTAESRNFVKVESTDRDKLCYPCYLYESERNIVRILSDKGKLPVQHPPLHLRDINMTAPHIKNYSYEQKLAIANCINEAVAVINGGPGTGKTTIIKAIISYLKLHFPQPKIVLAAPTGKAAQVMKQKTNHPTGTIHKLIGWEGQQYNRKLAYNPHALTIVPDKLTSKQTGVLIIDEMSMVSTWLLAHALATTADFQKVILIGDSHQLPSLEPGSVFNDLVTYRKYPLTTLREVYRHHADQGQSILTLTQLMQGGDGAKINHFFDQLSVGASVELIELTHPEKVLSEILRIYRGWNAQNLKHDQVQVVSPMYKRTLGVDEINNFLQQRLQEVPGYYTPGSHKFQIGDKVMQIENREEVKNGEIGQVTSINLHVQTDDFLKVTFNDHKVIYYTRDQLSQLNLAYACTVHKTQGNEFRETILVVQTIHQNMLKRPLLYTAVTRAQQKITIIGQRETFLRGVERVPTPRRTGFARLLGNNSSHEI